MFNFNAIYTFNFFYLAFFCPEDHGWILLDGKYSPNGFEGPMALASLDYITAVPETEEDEEVQESESDNNASESDSDKE